MARAIATLCCCPPDNWVGLLLRRFSKPTLINADVARSFLSPGLTPAYTIGNMTFSRAVN